MRSLPPLALGFILMALLTPVLPASATHPCLIGPGEQCCSATHEVCMLNPPVGTDPRDVLSVTTGGMGLVLYDVPRFAWYALYVQQAAEAGIVGGYKDARSNLTGQFGPADPVTLAQALKMAVQAAGYNPRNYGSVTPGGHWAQPYLLVAQAEGFLVFRGQADIDRPATRGEVAQIFTDAFRVDTQIPVDNALNDVTAFTRFHDVTASTNFAFSVEALSRDGVVSGDTDANGTPLARFRPTDQINRAEAVKIVMKARLMYGQPGQGHPSSSSAVSSSAPSSASSSATTALSSSAALRTLSVDYTESGYLPLSTDLHAGDTVTFTNNSHSALRVASNPHPAHTDYPGFDSGTLQPGQTYSFTFTKAGTWYFHNHFNPTQTGRVVVK